MHLDAETLTKQIPYYLTAEDQKVLLKELTVISRGGTAEYLLSAEEDSFREVMLQGDGWRGFQHQVPWSKGKSFSEEHREKLSKAKLGKTPWNKGLTPSEQHRSRMSEAAKNRKPRSRNEKGQYK